MNESATYCADDALTGKASFLKCPRCGVGAISEAKSIVFCLQCRRTFSRPNGVPNFRLDPSYYWGELDKATMQGMLDSPTPIDASVRALLKTCDRNLAAYLRQYVFSRVRAAWKFLAQLPPDATIMDFGCGLGAIALSLAENAGRIIVSDIVPERVAFTVRRLKEHGFENVVGFATAGLPRLPLPDASVDLIVVNGVLEWLPASIAGNPTEVQKAFLAEAHRVLKPTGQIYVGIENRFGGPYFSGKREEHTRLKYISLLPRPIGRLYHRLAKRAPYRAYTYGRSGLRALTQGVGFSRWTYLYPYPDYREFSKVIDLDDLAWVVGAFSPKTRKGKWAFWLSKNLGLLKYFANSFGLLAGSEPASLSFVQRLIDHVSAQGLIRNGGRVTSYDVRTSATVSLMYTVGEERLLFSIPLDQRSERRLRREEWIKEKLSREVGEVAEQFKKSADRSLEFEGRMVAVTHAARGVRAESLKGDVGSTDEACFGWLMRFHRQNMSERLIALEDILPHEMQPACDRINALTQGMVKRVFERQLSVAMHVGPIHGDFHSGNVFMTSEGVVERVIDWDLGQMTGLPLWDAMTFVLHRHLDQGLTWAQAFDVTVRDVIGHGDESVLGRYIREMKLGPADVSCSLVTFPILHLFTKLTFGNENEDEIVDGVQKVLRRETLGALLP